MGPVILDVLGHQDLRMLRRYQHVTDPLRQDATDEIDRIVPVDSSCHDHRSRTNSGGYRGGA